MVAGVAATLPLHQPSDQVRNYLNRDITLGLRPELIGEFKGGDGLPAGRCRLAVDIDVTEPTRADLLAVFRLGGKETVARLRAESTATAGQRFECVVDMTKAVLFDPESGVRV